MTKDLISREDALQAKPEFLNPVCGINEGWNKAISEYWENIKALPSAEAEPTVIRSRTLMPTKDFKEWAKRVRETNPNAVVIPCDAEVVSTEAVQGEWIDAEMDYGECSECGFFGLTTDYCPNCGALMMGDD